MEPLSPVVTSGPEPEGPVGVFCSSCGRFVGPYDRCPHCQARVEKTVSLRLVRAVVAWGAVLGLVAMYFASRAKEVPDLRVEAIDLRHNMALVRITGRVTGMRLRPETNTFQFQVDDGTGRLQVTAFNRLKVFQRALGQDFPSDGDTVAVTGNLNLTEKFGASVFLSNPHRLRVLEKNRIEARTIGSLTRADRGRRVRVRASVARAPVLLKGLRIVPLQDGTGEIGLSIPDTDHDALPDASLRHGLATTGTPLVVIGQVDEYRDRLQLRFPGLSEAGALAVTTAPGPGR